MKKILNILLIIMSGITGAIWGAVKICRKMTQSIEKMEESIEKKEESKQKFKGYYNLTIHWMDLNYRGINLSRSLTEQGIHTLAIYGMGELGRRLLLELKDSQIRVAYGIDQEIVDIDGVKVVKPDSELEAVDAIIVTPFHIFHKIEKVLENKVSCPVLSLERLVFGMEKQDN